MVPVFMKENKNIHFEGLKYTGEFFFALLALINIHKLSIQPLTKDDAETNNFTGESFMTLVTSG